MNCVTIDFPVILFTHEIPIIISLFVYFDLFIFCNHTQHILLDNLSCSCEKYVPGDIISDKLLVVFFAWISCV